MPPKLKILHFLNCSGHGGDAFVALELARLQMSEGHDSRLMIGSGQNAHVVAERAAGLGVPVIAVPGIKTNNTDRAIIRYFHISRALNSSPADVLHYHSANVLVRRVDAYAVSKAGFQCRIATIHAPCDWTIFPDPDSQKKQWRRASSYFNQIVSVSAWSKSVQMQAGIPFEKVTIVPNPVDTAKIDAADGTPVVRELNLPPGSQMILFAGRMVEPKRPGDALGAFANIAAEFPNSFLALAGRGAEEDKCRAEAANLGLRDRVIILGLRPDVPSLLKAADIVILPTESDSFNLVLVEAMAAGLPVITTPIGANLEAVTDEESALIVDVGDVEGFARSMRRLLSDVNLRQKLGTNARERSKNYAAEKVSSLYHDVYSRFMKHARTKG